MCIHGGLLLYIDHLCRSVWVERYNVTKSCWFGLRQPCMKLISQWAQSSRSSLHILLLFFSIPEYKPLKTLLRYGGIFAVQVISNA